ncbi:MAG: hypothetical protein ACOWWR_01185 [Eubacteriales bacterium]
MDNVEPFISLQDNNIVIIDDLTGIEKSNSSTKRLRLFGNGGLFRNYVLLISEKSHSIYNYHSSVLYNPKKDEFYIIFGGAGAGKTVLIMQGIIDGLELFGAEHAHIKIENNQAIIYKGCLWDNIRLGTLVEDFPEVKKILGVDAPSEIQDIWNTKVVTNFDKVSCSFDKKVNPSITLLFPHIEKGIGETQVREITNKKTLRRILFENLLEKTCKVQFVSEKFPLPPLDTKETISAKLNAVDQFLEKGRIKRAIRILSSPRGCWKIN